MPNLKNLVNGTDSLLTFKSGVKVQPHTVGRRLLPSEIERVLSEKGITWEIQGGDYVTTSAGSGSRSSSSSSSSSGGGTDVYVADYVVEADTMYGVLTNGEKKAMFKLLGA